MEMKPVQSYNINKIGYDHSTGQMHVEFSNGSKYIYSDVPAEAHDAFVNAESVGRHFWQYVRGQYEFIKG